MAWSPNEPLIASGSNDKTVQVWQASSISSPGPNTWSVHSSPVRRCTSTACDTRSQGGKAETLIESLTTCLCADGDGKEPEPHKAWNERFEPGYALVQQVQEDICKDLLPVIPVQAIEAWMLADHEILLEEIGTKMRPDELNIPTKQIW